MLIGIKKIGEKPIYIETTEKYRLKCAKEYLGKYTTIEFANLNNDKNFFVAVDEDGLMKNLPINFLIDMPESAYSIQKIVGTAVFIRQKPVTQYGEIYDYEVEGLTESDQQYIDKLLSTENQHMLNGKFKNY